ncbi:hypothetical protein RBSH_04854 [Rhodopirellula baltica SH28]|uniref:Uncharacterized protein n=2 Tax=Rhodopirellula baltica TaxID=265606 RepID=F2ARQ2_RHOBT|nr:hypothetical protein RBWH47_00540 [Rhodopirellula baltica WH47]EKJ99770.1 hypothetical protein RBSH_04854 [Rhodopirellula baltica SH28]
MLDFGTAGTQTLGRREIIGAAARRLSSVRPTSNVPTSGNQN